MFEKFLAVPGCSGGVPGGCSSVPGCSGGVPGVFRGVPGCSGVFRGCVPGFTDTRFRTKILWIQETPFDGRLLF